MTEILKAILTGIEQVRDQRLLPALYAKASRAPYNASQQALAYIGASADALQRFVDASRILDLLPASQASYGSSADFEFSTLKRGVAGAGPDLQAALDDPQLRSKLSYSSIVLQSLRDLFQRHVAVGRTLARLQLARWRRHDRRPPRAARRGRGRRSPGLAPRSAAALATSEALPSRPPCATTALRCRNFERARRADPRGRAAGAWT
jgi:hypothetical protein